MLLIAAEEKNQPDAIEATYVIEMLVMVTIKCRTSPDFDPMSHYLFKSIFVVRSTTVYMAHQTLKEEECL